VPRSPRGNYILFMVTLVIEIVSPSDTGNGDVMTGMRRDLSCSHLVDLAVRGHENCGLPPLMHFTRNRHRPSYCLVEQRCLPRNGEVRCHTPRNPG